MNKITLFLICLFLGPLGIHHFIQGNYKKGFLYLFTGGLLGVGWLYDLIKILISNDLVKRNRVNDISNLEVLTAIKTTNDNHLTDAPINNTNLGYKEPVENIKSKKEIRDSYEGLSNKEILVIYSEDDRVYEVNIMGDNEIQLVAEPENKFDPNAIQVVHEDIGHVGYVPAVDCKKVKNALENGYSIEWKLIGGKYKYIEYDFEKDKDVVKIENSTYGIMITLAEP